MARNATPLVVAPALPRLENRVEVLFANARLKMPFLPDSDQISEPLATILISFDPPEAPRRSARMLAASFVAAGHSISQAPIGADVGSWLTDALRELAASSVCIVIALPAHSPDVERQLQTFLEATRSAGHHHLSLVVGVSVTPADWARCGLDGFVATEEGQRDSDALQMFAALAAVMAPVLMWPLDADDFRYALGNAERPSRIVEAIFCLADHRFEPTSGRAKTLLARSEGVAVMPSRGMRLASQCHLIDSVRENAKPAAAIAIIAPMGLTIDPVGSPDIVHAFLLCHEAPTLL